ncbi:MAG: NUDIX hydrolase [Proteobacteria bacterium]|nr:NUDIX hydrolase [Pseudomonadota bacterium]
MAAGDHEQRSQRTRGGAVATHSYEWPRPAVTVDLIVLRGSQILLIQRDREPFAGRWALPGGFVDEGEDLETAARRELLEETGLKAGTLRQFRAFGDPGRDPRGWTIAIAFVSEDTPGEPQAGDDAREARWFDQHALPSLAFDHDLIVQAALASLD